MRRLSVSLSVLKRHIENNFYIDAQTLPWICVRAVLKRVLTKEDFNNKIL